MSVVYEFSCERDHERGADHITITAFDVECDEVVKRFADFLMACEFQPETIQAAFKAWLIP